MFFSSYDEYLDNQDHWASWARAQEEAYWQHQHDAEVADWEEWCWQHGQYPLPDEYYSSLLPSPDQENSLHMTISHD